MQRRIPVALLTTALVGVLAAGCGSSSSSSPATTSSSRPARNVAAEPAGAEPSASARMVCAPEAQKDIASALGVKPTSVSTPTWVDHVYSCKYQFPAGVMSVSVKELSDAAATTSWFDGLAGSLGRRPDKIALGQGAFLTTDGSVVVRKDYKVLHVDVSGLPPSMGHPPVTRDQAATSTAVVVLGCWTGA